MSNFPLQFPPGLYRNGTEYQGKGRWKDCNLVRFAEGAIQPEGGWRKKSTSAVTGKARAIKAWVTNDGSTFAAIGTHSKLYAMSRSGVLSDITPAGFTSGRADALAGGGYGGSTYGSSAFGAPRPDASAVQPASMWTLDNFGEHLVGCMAEDGKVYEWALNTATPAAPVTNAPTAAAVFTTTEGALVALGAAGVPRRIQWSDIENDTVWAASATNSAGDKDIQTEGSLLQGIRFSNTHLVLTTVDLWTMTFTPTDVVYQIVRVPGAGCGGVSRNCLANAGNVAVWMGANGFFAFNGYVQPMMCDVWDAVFGDINRQQLSKVTVKLNASFNEVTWQYPSSGSTECNRTVTWNYKENHWRTGYVARLSGCDRGVFQYPLAVGTDGYVYEHEVGFAYDGALPYLESGPFDVLNGAVVFYASQLMPDELTQGQVTATFFVKFAPEDAETSFGPYTLSAYTDVRFPARQARLRYDGVTNASWRVGIPRLGGEPGGDR